MTTPTGSVARVLLDVAGLTVEYPVRHRQPLRAIDGVDLVIGENETVGLVGESGSGKSTLGRAILGLASIKTGSIRFDGMDITHANSRERRSLSSQLQVVFQDPYSSLSPTMTIGDILSEPLRVHRRLSRAETEQQVRSALEQVGLPTDAANRFPAHFSGGQRQRIAIARALMLRPRLIICDEPVSALDLAVQAQVVNLLEGLQAKFQVSYLFIAHDLSVVSHLSRRVVVLYRGRVMEQGDAEIIYSDPTHPYTRALMEAEPVPDPEVQRARRSARRHETTDVERPAIPYDACPFASRCSHVIDICVSRRPALELTPRGTLVACHRWRELDATDDRARRWDPLAINDPSAPSTAPPSNSVTGKATDLTPPYRPESKLNRSERSPRHEARQS